MRPLVLSVEGFASFREPTTVDFRDCDYFALVGPTGAGKSSLIDAIGFALYGSIPRYEDRRLVAPVITQGQVEARVGLEFALGPDRYRAVRVVRASARGRGATTKEARLERIGEGGEDVVLAGDADGVSREAERLLGLSFDHFTKCVVLPQGAFAQFLHDKPADRQGLLVELLDLGIYETVARTSHTRAQMAATKASSMEAMLARPPLADATPSALTAAHERVTVLEALSATVAAAEPEIARLGSEAAEAASAAAVSAAKATTLGRVRAPAGIAELAASIALANTAADAATAALAVAEKEVIVAEEAIARLPARAAVEAEVMAQREIGELDQRLAKGTAAVKDLRAATAAAVAAVDQARVGDDQARARREEAFVHDQAAALAVHLVAGQPCPVCRQAVGVLPPTAAPADLAAADAKVARATADLRRAEAASRDATDKLSQADALLTQLQERRQTIGAAVRRPAAEAAADLEALALSEQRLDEAKAAERKARTVVRDAAARSQDLRAAEAEAQAAFDRCRDTVAAFGPPAPARADLSADWDALASWASAAASTAASEQEAAEARRQSAARELDGLTAWLEAACREAGVALGQPRIGEAVAAARSAAAANASTLERAAAEADKLRTEITEATTEAAVARSLSQHLNAAHFEKWLLDEALELLVEGATQILADLSAGAYSLTLEGPGGFAVIDHRNADQVRSARTLSGGETFLASLALALALADRIGELAADGSARLESIFLDEGFGTLDPDTLDVVASAIEALASDGRVVGLVTHVRDLAERVPVRYEVTKDLRSSSVRRVEV